MHQSAPIDHPNVVILLINNVFESIGCTSAFSRQAEVRDCFAIAFPKVFPKLYVGIRLILLNFA
jgi:hypothetical protein